MCSCSGDVHVTAFTRIFYCRFQKERDKTEELRREASEKEELAKRELDELTNLLRERTKKYVFVLHVKKPPLIGIPTGNVKRVKDVKMYQWECHAS